MNKNKLTSLELIRFRMYKTACIFHIVLVTIFSISLFFSCLVTIYLILTDNSFDVFETQIEDNLLLISNILLLLPVVLLIVITQLTKITIKNVGSNVEKIHILLAIISLLLGNFISTIFIFIPKNNY